MFEDSFDYSMNVVHNISRPEEINGLFTPFTYNKGASILFMLESIVGPDSFQSGIKVYIFKLNIIDFNLINYYFIALFTKS
jgi:aminopeptidase N